MTRQLQLGRGSVLVPWTWDAGASGRCGERPAYSRGGGNKCIPMLQSEGSWVCEGMVLLNML